METVKQEGTLYQVGGTIKILGTEHTITKLRWKHSYGQRILLVTVADGTVFNV